MTYLSQLADEINTDPLGRGYSGMTDEEVTADLNTVYRTITIGLLDGAEVYEAIDVTEYQALTSENKAEVWNIVHLGPSIAVGVGTKARSRFISLFGGGSTTMGNLLARVTKNVSRAEELGLGRVVLEGHVTKARAQ